MIYALLKTLHVLAVMLWVGGMLFAHFMLRPALTVLEPPQRLALMHAVLGRFFTAVLWASLLTLVSGFWMIGRMARSAAQTGGQFIWPADWLAMAILGTLMVAVFGHIRFVLWRRLDRAQRAGEAVAAASALASIRTWVLANLVLGLVVVVLAVLV
ncbi:MAG: CopD family protein [Pseudomonadota bacterium]